MVSAEEIKTTLIVAMISGVFIGMILLSNLFQVGVIYMLLLIFSIMLLLNWNAVISYVSPGSDNIYGVEPGSIWEQVKRFSIGVGSGGATWLTGKLMPGFSMAVPVLQLALSGQALVIIGIAPIAEELFFTCILLSFGVLVLERNHSSCPFTAYRDCASSRSFWIANIAKSLIFSAYHLWVYAGIITASAVLSMSGAFIAAFLFSLLSGWLARKYGLMASIGAHMTFNFIIFSFVIALVVIT